MKSILVMAVLDYELLTYLRDEINPNAVSGNLKQLLQHPVEILNKAEWRFILCHRKKI